jgi:hypothetical protein
MVGPSTLVIFAGALNPLLPFSAHWDKLTILVAGCFGIELLGFCVEPGRFGRQVIFRTRSTSEVGHGVDCWRSCS